LTDWAKIGTALDQAARARQIKAKMDECASIGKVRVDDNDDLAIPYTAAVQSLYQGRLQTLLAAAKADLDAGA